MLETKRRTRRGAQQGTKGWTDDQESRTKQWTKNQGKEPSVKQVVYQDTKSCEPRPKVKNQAWAKWRTKIKLVSQVKNQVVNQAKTNDKCAKR